MFRVIVDMECKFNYFGKLLNDGMVASLDDADTSDKDQRLIFLSDHIFNYDTYDGDRAIFFAEKTIFIIYAILHKKTFDLIQQSKENYYWYLAICNMPFLANNIEWGTSIRGAWFNHSITIKSCGLYHDDEQIIDLDLEYEHVDQFFGALINFALINDF